MTNVLADDDTLWPERPPEPPPPPPPPTPPPPTPPPPTPGCMCAVNGLGDTIGLIGGDDTIGLIGGDEIIGFIGGDEIIGFIGGDEIIGSINSGGLDDFIDRKGFIDPIDSIDRGVNDGVSASNPWLDVLVNSSHSWPPLFIMGNVIPNEIIKT